ncbi:MAG: response regulator [Nitrospinae bacterium]|nr:response regulator [Nitrospinota bacterium]
MRNLNDYVFVGMSILMVDDTPANLTILKDILIAERVYISIALDGKKALEIIEEKKPDLILLDIMMTGMNGYEVCEKLKKDERTKDIPIIFVTAMAQTEDIIKGFSVGGADYITKPFQEKEVLARVRNQLSLRKTLYEKDELIKELNDFSLIASHDLQEPLRKIICFGDRLKDGMDNRSEKCKDYVDIMQKSASRMQLLINDLLQLSKVSTQAIPFKSVNLNQVAKEVLENLEAQMIETNGAVNLESLPALQADPTQIRQLFQNLISNSLKYHRDGVSPVVNVECKKTGDGFWKISFVDNGIGFDKKHTKRIFKVFERLHGKSSYSGTGMGLAICKKIIDRHCGTITAKSVVGEGSTFVVTLPEKLPSN